MARFFHTARSGLRRPWPFLFCMLFALASCGSTAAVREFQSYKLAFDAVEDASDIVFADIAVSERKTRTELIDASARNGIADTLDRGDIAIFAPSADPPFVAALRFAVATVADFNDIMLAYAEGRALTRIKGEVRSIRSAGVGFAAVADDKGSPIGEVGGSIGALNVGLDALLAAGSREAFRQQMRVAGGDLDRVLDTILKHSSTAFRLLTQDEFAELRLASATNPSAVPDLQQRIATKRAMLAEWLHLIDQSRGALAAVLVALDHPQSSQSRLVDAAVLAGDLRARAAQIKRLAVAD